MSDYEAEQRLEKEEQTARIERRQQDAIERKHKIRRNRFIVAAVAAVAIGIGISTQVDSSNSRKSKTTQIAKNPFTKENLGEPPQFSGIRCYSDRRIRMEPGQTVYSLSVEGLASDPSFKDAVYIRNKLYVEKQAKRNRALAVFTDIPIGTKVKILGDCINYFPVGPYWDGSSNKPRFDKHGNLIPDGYERTLTYQNYLGTDDKRHSDVWVDYLVKQDGQPIKVIDCRPAPQCDSYVVGTPKAPAS